MGTIEHLRELMKKGPVGPLHLIDADRVILDGKDYVILEASPGFGQEFNQEAHTTNLVVAALNNLPQLLAVVEAAQSTAYNSEHLGDGTTRCPSDVIDRLRAALAPLTTTPTKADQ
jgi:hypothetical protein